MTLSELVESVETIAGRPAVDVLSVAFTQLGERGDGMILLMVDGDGACTVAREAAVHA
jgi:hypothetical protein